MLQEHYQVGAAHGAVGQGGVGVPRTTRLGRGLGRRGQGGVGDEPEVAPAR